MALSVILYDSDEVEVIFHNGMAVKLSPCGANVILPVETSPDFHPVSQPRQLHQRTKFVTHQYRSQVRTALDFRNRFAEKVFLCRELLESDSIMEYYADIKVVDWPSSAASVVINSDGSLSLTSVDECASLTLAPNRQEFSALFLCKINREQEYSKKSTLSKNRSGEVSKTKVGNVYSQRALKDISYKLNFNPEEQRKSTQKDKVRIKSTSGSDDAYCTTKPLYSHRNLLHYYVWQVQNHSVDACPEIWRYPLGLLINTAKYLPESQDGKGKMISEDMYDEAVGCTSIQGNRSILPASLPEKCPRSHLHEKVCFEEKWVLQTVPSDDVDDIRLWRKGKRIKVFYSRGVIYRVLWQPEPSLEIYPGNGSVLKSMPGEGLYFNYFSMKDGRLQEQILSVKMPPPANVQCGSHMLASVLKRGYRFLSQMKLIDRNTADQSEAMCWKEHHDIPVVRHNSLQLIEECKIEGIGHFAAFSNGYLRIKLRDRTTIELQVDPLYREADASSEQHTKRKSNSKYQIFPENVCRILQPSGKEYMVDMNNSHDTNGYTQIATEWATWVSLSKEQKLNARRNTVFDVDKIREVGLELERIQQFNSISSQEWTHKAHQASSSDEEISSATIQRVLERNSAKIQDIEDALKDF